MKRTMRALRYAVVLLLAALYSHQACLAQDGPWDRVKLVEPGKKVHVKLRSGKTVKGKMESWSTDGLSVRQGGDKVVPLAKSDVVQVAMVIGKSRGEKAGYAFLIGGGAGAAVFGAAFGALCASSGCEVHPAYFAVGGALWVGGIASGVAALFPQHKEVIYRAESPVAVRTPNDPAVASSPGHR